ncbi:MAG: tetratricopeptide repeat protein [Candidatus Krumholzibacteriota bacterium]
MSDIRHLMEFRQGCDNTGFSDIPSLNMAYRHLYAGDREEAERRFQDILKDDPLDNEAMAGLAVCVAEDGGKFLTAEKLARKAVQMGKKSAAGYIALGYVNLRGGRLEDGYRYLMKAKHLAPKDPRIHSGFALYDRERPPVISDLSRLHPVNRVLGGARSYLDSPTHRAFALAVLTGGLVIAGSMLV